MAIKAGQNYKMVNSHNEDTWVMIVEGEFLINGKILNKNDNIKVRGNSSVVLQTYKF